MSYRVNAAAITQARKFIKGTEQAVRLAQFRSVNRVTTKFRTEASKLIRDQVRLKKGYVDRHLSITKTASLQNPSSVITARYRPTRLMRFGGKQLSTRARKAAGDQMRAIAPGRKQAGVSVHVSRQGSRKKMRKAFLLPLNNGNGFGVFTRTGKGRNSVEHLYGPSVNQVFRTTMKDLEPTIRRELQAEFKRQFNFARQKETKR